MVKLEHSSEFDHDTQSDNLGDRPLAVGASALKQFLAGESAIHDRADTIIAAMTESLELDGSEVRLVIEEPSVDGRRITAIDASPMGQRIGTYAAIYERRATEPDWYMVEVDGQLVDPLAGCTRAAYNAMIADARSRGVLLPDSLALSQQSGELWTATMLTGEPLDDEGLVVIASSNSDDKINNVGFPLDRGGKSIRVRPALVVHQLDMD